MFDVEAVRGMRKTRVRPASCPAVRAPFDATAQGGHVEYLIKWAGYSSDQNSWEREECVPLFPSARPALRSLCAARNLQCPEKVEEFHEAQRQKAAAKRARAASSGKTSGGEENSGSAANVRSPVKSEGPAKDDGSGRSPVVAAKGEKKSVENGDEVERIMGARRNAMTSELELYVKWCATRSLCTIRFYRQQRQEGRARDELRAREGGAPQVSGHAHRLLREQTAGTPRAGVRVCVR